jgi:hypothetical protein
MSAGGISYSGITNYGKATLPSVDSWGTNMNILKDPPKSITTRKIDKVGQTSDITQMIDESGDRACGTIMQYARGVNPMVSVSYQNSGLTSSGIVNTFNSGQQAYPPYIIMPQGSFRPPVLRQENLYPLSRLPRTWTSTTTNPGLPDYTKKIMCQGTSNDYKAVHNNVLKGNIRPTAVYKIQTPIRENFEVKYVIQNPIHVSANSGKRTMDITNQYVDIPTKELNTNNINTSAKPNISLNVHVNNNSEFHSEKYIQDTHHSNIASNASKNIHINNNSEFHPEKYIQDTHHSNIASNASKNINVTNLSDLIDFNVDTKIKDKININYTTPQSSSNYENYITTEDDIILSRKLPEYSSHTNIGKNEYKMISPDNDIELQRKLPNSSGHTNLGIGLSNKSEFEMKNYEKLLPPKPQYGGFMSRSAQPTLNRPDQIREYETEKQVMSKKIMDTMQGRFMR